MFTVCSVHVTRQIQINIQYFESIFVQQTTHTCIESTSLKTPTATATTTTNNNENKNFSKLSKNVDNINFPWPSIIESFLRSTFINIFQSVNTNLYWRFNGNSINFKHSMGVSLLCIIIIEPKRVCNCILHFSSRLFPSHTHTQISSY